MTLLTLKFRRVHNSLSFWHSHSESLCSFSKFAISYSSTVSDNDNFVSLIVSQPLSHGSHGKCNACCPIHPIQWDIFHRIPVGIPFPWTSPQILALTDEKQFVHKRSDLEILVHKLYTLDASVTTFMSLPTACEWQKNSGKTIVGVTSITMNRWTSVSVIVLSKWGSMIGRSVQLISSKYSAASKYYNLWKLLIFSDKIIFSAWAKYELRC